MEPVGPTLIFISIVIFVMVAKHIATGVDYAVKREPVNELHPQLTHEAKMYEKLAGGGKHRFIYNMPTTTPTIHCFLVYFAMVIEIFFLFFFWTTIFPMGLDQEPLWLNIALIYGCEDARMPVGLIARPLSIINFTSTVP